MAKVGMGEITHAGARDENGGSGRSRDASLPSRLAVRRKRHEHTSRSKRPGRWSRSSSRARRCRRLGGLASPPGRERYDVIVIGGGQAGLSVGYYLRRRGLRFVILDASERIGDAWRKRWDSLRLFTPAKLDGLDGMRFPAPPELASRPRTRWPTTSRPTRRGSSCPSRTRTRVERLSRRDGALRGEDGRRRARGRSGGGRDGELPAPAGSGVRPGASPRHRPAALARLPQPGAAARRAACCIVGAGNSGAEIAMELGARPPRSGCRAGAPGEVPFRIDGLAARLFLARLVLRVRLSPGADDQDADRAQGAPEDHLARGRRSSA